MEEQNITNESPNSVVRIWNLLARSILKILSGDTGTEGLIILPENIRYALRYKEALLYPGESVSLLEEKYGFLGVYLCLKYYENDIDNLCKHLEFIMQGIKEGKSFHQYTQKLRDDILKLPKNLTILGLKSAQVSRNGFVDFSDGVSKLFNSQKAKGIPILVAFSGFLGMKGIVEEMLQGESFFIFLPKNKENEVLLKVLYLENAIKIEIIIDSKASLEFNNQNIIIIDDTQNSGVTFEKVSKKIQLFSNPKNIIKKAFVVVGDKS